MAYACCQPHSFETSTEAEVLRKSLVSLMALQYTYICIYSIL